jgi:hypothetical protein
MIHSLEVNDLPSRAAGDPPPARGSLFTVLRGNSIGERILAMRDAQYSTSIVCGVP